MKKLMCFAAALTAGIALADISSSNVVGYQNQTLNFGFNFTVPTFTAISGDFKLGDIKGKDLDMYANQIQFLADDGSCLLTDEYPEFGDVVFLQFMYVEDADVPGWYLNADEEYKYPQNDRVIPAGQGFLIEGAGGGEYITFAGAVGLEDTEIVLAFGFNFSGNCTPVDIKFGDITAKDLDMYANQIQLLADDGSCLLTDEYPEFGDVVFLQFMYVEDADVPGWYLNADEEYKYPQNDRVIPAGQGFLIEGAGGGESITVPAAM